MLRYLSVKEASVEVKRHPETIRDALRTKSLHGGQNGKGPNGSGGSWRIREDCLDAWMIGQPCSHRASVKAAA